MKLIKISVREFILIFAGFLATIALYLFIQEIMINPKEKSRLVVLVFGLLIFCELIFMWLSVLRAMVRPKNQKGIE